MILYSTPILQSVNWSKLKLFLITIQTNTLWLPQCMLPSAVAAVNIKTFLRNIHEEISCFVQLEIFIKLKCWWFRLFQDIVQGTYPPSSVKQSIVTAKHHITKSSIQYKKGKPVIHSCFTWCPSPKKSTAKGGGGGFLQDFKSTWF